MLHTWGRAYGLRSWRGFGSRAVLPLALLLLDQLPQQIQGGHPWDAPHVQAAPLGQLRTQWGPRGGQHVALLELRHLLLQVILLCLQSR